MVAIKFDPVSVMAMTKAVSENISPEDVDDVKQECTARKGDIVAQMNAFIKDVAVKEGLKQVKF